MDSSIHILWHNVATIHQTACHVLTMPGVTFCHHTWWLKHRICDLGNRVLFMLGLLHWDNRSIRREHKVYSRIRHKVGLELSYVNINSSIKPQRGGQRWYNLRYEPVQIGICWALNVKGSLAYVIDSFIVKKHNDISVFNQGMCGEHTIIRLNNSSWNLQQEMVSVQRTCTLQSGTSASL